MRQIVTNAPWARAVSRGLAPLALVLFGATTAWAHGSRPSVFDIVERDGDVLGMATTFGVIHDGGGGLTWACTGAVPATPTGYLFAGDDVIATTTDGLWISDDSGCSYEALDADITDPVVTEVRRDGVTGATWLVTASLDAPNGVYRSGDNGRTWSAVGDLLDQTALYGLAVADDRVVVTALNASDGWTVLELTEGGAVPVAPAPESLLDVEVWLAGDDVWLADIRMVDSTLYGPDETGEAFSAWGEPVEGVITDVVAEGGEIYVATDTNAVYRATPDALIHLEDEAGACFVDDAPGATLRCGTTAAGVAAYAGEIGAHQPRIGFDDIVPAACVYEADHPCASVAEFATGFLGGDDVGSGGVDGASDGGGGGDDAVGEPKREGCSAASHRGARWPGLLIAGLVAIGVRPRRA